MSVGRTTLGSNGRDGDEVLREDREQGGESVTREDDPHRPVGEEDALRTPHVRLRVDELQVARYAERDEDGGQRKILRPEPRRRLRREGVPRVHGESGEGGGEHEDVERHGVVALQRLARLRGDLELVPALREGEEKRQRERAAEEPCRYANVHRRRACDSAKDEPGRYHRDVDVGDALEEARVRALHHRVYEQHGEAERAVRMAEDEEAREHQPRGEKRKSDPHRVDARDETRGDGPEALHRMQPVGVEVGDVVEKVERARHEAERGGHSGYQDERTPPARHRGLRGIGHREEPREEDDPVLRPLVHADRPQPYADALSHFGVPQRIMPQRSEWCVQVARSSRS